MPIFDARGVSSQTALVLGRARLTFDLRRGAFLDAFSVNV